MQRRAPWHADGERRFPGAVAAPAGRSCPDDAAGASGRHAATPVLASRRRARRRRDGTRMNFLRDLAALGTIERKVVLAGFLGSTLDAPAGVRHPRGRARIPGRQDRRRVLANDASRVPLTRRVAVRTPRRPLQTSIVLMVGIVLFAPSLTSALASAMSSRLRRCHRRSRGRVRSYASCYRAGTTPIRSSAYTRWTPALLHSARSRRVRTPCRSNGTRTEVLGTLPFTVAGAVSPVQAPALDRFGLILLAVLMASGVYKRSRTMARRDANSCVASRI